MRTTKISIAIDKDQLRLARQAAETEGLSLSAYIARALGSQLEDQQRLEAARRLYKSWGAESIPTPLERDAFLSKMFRRKKRGARAA